MSAPRSILLAALAAACTTLVGNFDRIVAIEIVGTSTPQVEEGDTLRLAARALTAAGDPAPTATIVWAIVDVDSGQIGFTLDADGLISAVFPSSARVQARVGTLPSATIAVTVTGAPDSVAAVGDPRLNFDPASATSPPLVTLVLDLTTSPGQQLPLSGKTVEYQLVDPSAGSDSAQGIFLTPLGGITPGADPHHVAVQTGTTGQANSVVQRIEGEALPDSAIIHATALSARGDTVAGSPVQFVVVFQ